MSPIRCAGRVQDAATGAGWIGITGRASAGGRRRVGFRSGRDRGDRSILRGRCARVTRIAGKARIGAGRPRWTHGKHRTAPEPMATPTPQRTSRQRHYSRQENQLLHNWASSVETSALARAELSTTQIYTTVHDVQTQQAVFFQHRSLFPTCRVGKKLHSW